MTIENVQLIIRMQKMRVLLLSCFLHMWVQAARSLPLGEARWGLKPGTYYNLKPTESIVLDTGSYTFIGLEMRALAPLGGLGAVFGWMHGRPEIWNLSIAHLKGREKERRCSVRDIYGFKTAGLKTLK